MTREEISFFDKLVKEKTRAENRILILNNNGGHADPGRTLELYRDGRIVETLYTDAVGSERENSGTYHLEGDILTIQIGSETERLIRSLRGEKVFWIHDGNTQDPRSLKQVE